MIIRNQRVLHGLWVKGDLQAPINNFFKKFIYWCITNYNVRAGFNQSDLLHEKNQYIIKLYVKEEQCTQ